jgi:opacity protein-like surface antigen
MIKRILVASLSWTLAAQAALAGTFYVAPTLVLNDITAQQSSFRGLEPRLTLGYTAMVDKGIYMAGEAFGSMGNLVLQDNHPAGSDSLHISREFGLTFLPGIRISRDTLTFLRMGIVNSRFSTGDKSRFGAEFGVGLETELTENWDIRGEYDFTTYRSLSSATGNPRGDSYSVAFVDRFW